MNRYPAKPMMDEMAKYGRYGDTMLVHMNPAEVAGIASLVPGGRLTTNPVTGQPEAFLPLLLGFAAKGLGLSALGTGALVGAGTAAVTGDLKRGILSGLTAGFGAGIADAAAGVGEAAQVASDVVNPDVVANVGEIATKGTDVVAGGLGNISGPAGMVPPPVDGIVTGAGDVASNVATDPGMLDSIRSSVPDAFKSGTGIGEGISQNLGLTGNIAGAGIAAGTMEQDRLQEQFARQEMARLGEAEADRISHHACTRGTAVHDMIERYLKNENDVIGSNTLPHILSSWIAIQPVLDSRMGKISMLETPLYSHHLTVAGKVDCIAEFDGKLSVVDFKTSTRIKTSDEIHSYFMQEAAYAIMFEERPGTPITQLITIMMVENDPNPLIFKEHRDNWTDKLMKEIANYLISQDTPF